MSAADAALVVRVLEGRWYLRPVRTRMPFRYGSATLTRVPILHLRALVEAADGRRAEGWAADCLPPGWFDKRPGRTFRDDIAGLRWSAEQALAAALEQPPDTAFALWDTAEQATRAAGAERDEPPLVRAFGPALLERSLIDAVGKLAGMPFDETVRWNLLGLELGHLAAELRGVEPRAYLAAAPLETLAVRHTVGLVDPLTGADVPPEARLHDGLPQTLEEYAADRGVRYFKIKVRGDLEADLGRLETIAAVLAERIDGPWRVSLDGNEQFAEPAALLDWLAAARSRPALARLLESIEYLEQPFPRALALEPAVTRELAAVSAFRSVIIDESDGERDSFARAAALGYQGVSIKNCKGVGKAVANACLASHLNATRRPARPFFVSGEDLMNTAVVPLHQDLATAALLGVRHLERNGHHYVRGLDHLSSLERADCLERHASLYEPLGGDSGQLRICDGLLDLRSLRVPGYAVAAEPDWSAMTPAEQWRYEDLGLDG